MRIYLPRGAEMTEEDEAAWVRQVGRLTDGFREKYPGRSREGRYEIDSYVAMKRRSRYRKFVTPMWQEHYERAEELFLGKSNGFLRDDLLRYAFFLSCGGVWQQIQVPYLESRWEKSKLRRLLLEDPVFDPDITSEEYESSESLINHLTHVTEFQARMGVDVARLGCIVEFGGGYGGTCRLFRRLCGGATHIVVDLPVFLHIQSCYLKTLFGEAGVTIVGEGGVIEEGKINLVDVSDAEALETVGDFDVDLFVGTWSLSEANQRTQEMILRRSYFDARYLLIGYRHYVEPNPRQPCSDSIRLPSDYEIRYRGPTFFALAQEQYYLFAHRRDGATR